MHKITEKELDFFLNNKIPLASNEIRNHLNVRNLLTFHEYLNVQTSGFLVKFIVNSYVWTSTRFDYLELGGVYVGNLQSLNG